MSSSRRRDSRHRSRSRSRSPRRRISPHRLRNCPSAENSYVQFYLSFRSTVGRHREIDDRKSDRDRRLDGRDSARGWRDRRGRSAENVREHRQRDRSRERLGSNRSRERLGRNRSRERPTHRDDRRNSADLRNFISGGVNYDDPASRLSSQGDSQRRHSPSHNRAEGSRFSRYDRGQDWSRRGRMMRGEGQRERTRSTGSLNLNPTDVPRSDRYFEVMSL